MISIVKNYLGRGIHAVLIFKEKALSGSFLNDHTNESHGPFLDNLHSRWEAEEQMHNLAIMECFMSNKDS